MTLRLFCMLYRADLAVVSSYFLPQGPPEAMKVDWWVILLAVLAGLVLLVLLSYLLLKVISHSIKSLKLCTIILRIDL